MSPWLCLPGSSVPGILQARILEWVAYPFSRGSSQPRNWTGVSCIIGRFFTNWAPRDALLGGLHRIKYRKCYDTIWAWWLTPRVVMVTQALWGAGTQRPQPQGAPALKQSPGGHHQRPASALRPQLFTALCPVQISLNLPIRSLECCCSPIHWSMNSSPRKAQWLGEACLQTLVDRRSSKHHSEKGSKGDRRVSLGAGLPSVSTGALLGRCYSELMEERTQATEAE